MYKHIEVLLGGVLALWNYHWSSFRWCAGFVELPPSAPLSAYMEWINTSALCVYGRMAHRVNNPTWGTTHPPSANRDSLLLECSTCWLPLCSGLHGRWVYFAAWGDSVESSVVSIDWRGAERDQNLRRNFGCCNTPGMGLQETWMSKECYSGKGGIKIRITTGKEKAVPNEIRG